MNKESFVCPACGSKKIVRTERIGSDILTLGSEFTFQEVAFKCDSCGEEGDFFGETNKYYLVAQKNAQIDLVKRIVENLNKIGISMASFERVFELPTRTLTRWKTGDFSSSAIALLRIAITYPWIVEVAEHKFEPSFASQSILKTAARELEQKVKEQQQRAKIREEFVETKGDASVISIVNIPCLTNNVIFGIGG